MTSNSMRVAVIGGAGFIGSHLVDALVDLGLHVRIVDNLDPQVHQGGLPPNYLNPHADFIQQDVRDRDGLQKSIEGAESIFHLAGAVGVGDSMYRIRHYAETNVLGGANLLDILANKKHSVRKIVLASSVTVYGEGKYDCPVHGVVFPSVRAVGKGVDRRWDLQCPVQTDSAVCGEIIITVTHGRRKARHSAEHLRNHETHAGGIVSRVWTRVWGPGGCAPLFQCIRFPPGLVESLYWGSQDFRAALCAREGSAHL